MDYEDMTATYKGLFPDQRVIPVLTGNPTGHLMVSNDYTAEIVKKTGLKGLFCTGCDMTDEFIEEQVIKGGFDGLKPYCDNCPPHLNKLDVDIYDFMPESQFKLADKYGWKVLLHISKRDRIKNQDNVKRLLEIEQKYPNAKVILAHIGRAYSPEDLGDALEVLGKETKNLTVDFSANVSDEALRRCIEAFGVERVMFGTDLPVSKMKMYRISENGNYINVIPRGAYGDVSGDPHMRETDDNNMTNFTYEIVRCFKRVSKDLTLTRKEIEDIMCNNAAKLFDIKL
jgi:predicted TIM-barrel fold metal-dependent hydrolase